MKGDFVLKFISGVFEFIGELNEGLSRIPYKGFRYSDFDIYGCPVRKKYVGFKNLEHRGIIKETGSNSFKFTNKGMIWLSKTNLRYFKSKYPKWDRKWRLVIFDIPSELNKKRDTLRRRLKHLGFHMLQRSVFVFPYPCEEELSDLCEKLEVADYTDMVTAESMGSREEELVHLFDLK
ncbi:MAG: CRISPR-associated endonuclease Cas2 [bacterium]|nr:CRISPR-associated endonuclease Cas2 [bacterium]